VGQTLHSVGIEHIQEKTHGSGFGQSSTSNYDRNFIFNLQIQNWTEWAIELSKPIKFGLLGGYEGGFAFSTNFNSFLFGQNP
jgi:hypothetical protein